MTIGSQLGQYFVQAHIQKITKNQWDLNPHNLLLGTPLLAQMLITMNSRNRPQNNPP